MSHAAQLLSAMPFDFAQFLVERDAITATQAEAIRDRAQCERMPIGQLLLQTRDLTMKQVMAVLAAQADAPGEKFGQIAVRRGMITLRQLEDALRLQRVTKRHMIEIVATMGLFSASVLIELTVTYVSLLEMTMSMA